jgi:hypothetical protein
MWCIGVVGGRAWTARRVSVPDTGEARMDGGRPERTAQLRPEGQIAGSQTVGVTGVDFLDRQMARSSTALALRRDIAPGHSPP